MVCRVRPPKPTSASDFLRVILDGVAQALEHAPEAEVLGLATRGGVSQISRTESTMDWYLRLTSTVASPRPTRTA